MFKLALLTALVASGASALQMITPAALVQCQPVLLSWNSGTPPYYPSVLPANQPSAQALLTFPQTNDDKMTWIVNLPAGTAVSLSVTDGTGQQQWASVLTIQKGASDDCLNGNGTTSTSTSGTSSGTSSGSNAASGAPSAGGAAAGTASGAATPSASDSKNSTTSGTSGAGAVRVAGSAVAAGVIAALVL